MSTRQAGSRLWQCVAPRPAAAPLSAACAFGLALALWLIVFIYLDTVSRRPFLFFCRHLRFVLCAFRLSSQMAEVLRHKATCAVMREPRTPPWHVSRPPRITCPWHVYRVQVRPVALCNLNRNRSRDQCDARHDVVVVHFVRPLRPAVGQWLAPGRGSYAHCKTRGKSQCTPAWPL